MILLDATTDSLEIDLDGAITTNQLPFTAGYADLNQSTFAITAISNNDGATNNTTAVTMVVAPAASRTRKIAFLTVVNSDTAAAVVTIQLNANSTLRTLFKATLAVGDQINYADGLGFKVIDSSGQIKTTAASSTHEILSGTHSDSTAAGVSRGSLIYGNATPKWAELTVGAANRILHSDGTDVAWAQADHGAALTGLSDDDHTQYALLAGRSGGQVVTGGTGVSEDITLRPTTNATKGDVILADQGGNVTVGGAATASELRFLEPSGSGTNYTAIKAQAQAGDITYTLPAANGTNGVLLNDGSGGLTWDTDVSNLIDHGTVNGLADNDHPQYLLVADIDDTPVNGEVAQPISSNWAFDHVAAADPHTGYRLESEDHTHQSTGAQAGQLDHGLALTGLTDDDHTQYALLAGRSTGQIITGGTGASEDLTLRSTTNATKGDIILVDQGGNVTIGGGTTASELRILEASGSGTNYTAFKCQAQAADITYTLPADDGDADQVLATNGSGTLDWVAAGSSTPGGSNTQVQFNDSSAFGGDAGLVYNKTTDALTLAGQLIISGVAAGQIVFPATQNASSNANTLDDYEEGTWTPVIGGSGGTSGQTYTDQEGTYVKIGQLVFVRGNTLFSNKGTITGDLQLQGLPFTIVLSVSVQFVFAALATTWANVVARGTGSVGVISGAAISATSNRTALTTTDVGNASEFFWGFCYRTSA